MYNAIIDIGNTLVKIAVFKGDEFILMQVADEWDEKIFHITTKGYYIKNIIVSDVRYKEDKPYESFLKEKYNCLFTNQDTVLPIKNKYLSKNTLGFDRLAICVGARNYYSTNAILVISIGTCITYNFVNEANEFIGGAISAGIQMRLKSLHDYTGNLPLVKIEKSFDEISLIGNTTENSIISGVLLGAAAEIDGIIDKYLDNYDNLTVVLTGGDWSFLAYSLKNKIFAHPNLVLFGLNTILQQHVKT
jgi:type III pantothenate kinase